MNLSIGRDARGIHARDAQEQSVRTALIAAVRRGGSRAIAASSVVGAARSCNLVRTKLVRALASPRP